MLPVNVPTVSIPITELIVQSEAAPEATQGISATYASGISFNIGGAVTTFGPFFTGGVTWSNTKSVTIPALNIIAGNLEDAGAFWKFQYCTTSNTDVTDCINTLQTANPTTFCKNQLGPPQQGQTTDGKLSDSAQTVHWTVDPAYREGASTFDIKVTFQAALATTTMFVGNIVGDPGTCNVCGPFSGCCDCQVFTNKSEDTAKKDATFKVNFPPTTDCTSN